MLRISSLDAEPVLHGGRVGEVLEVGVVVEADEIADLVEIMALPVSSSNSVNSVNDRSVMRVLTSSPC